MQCSETVETVEICYVKCEDVTDTVYVHRCCQASVVDPHSGNVVLCYNPPPFLVNQSAVNQKKHASLDRAYFPLSFSSG